MKLTGTPLLRNLRLANYLVLVTLTLVGWSIALPAPLEPLLLIATFLCFLLPVERLLVLWLKKQTDYSDGAPPSPAPFAAAFRNPDWLTLLFAFITAAVFVWDEGWGPWGNVRWYFALATLPLLWKSAWIDYHFVWKKSFLGERALVLALWIGMMLNPAFSGFFLLAAITLYSRMAWPLELSKTDIALPLLCTVGGVVTLLLLPILGSTDGGLFMVIQVAMISASYLKPGVSKVLHHWHENNELVNLSYACEMQNEWRWPRATALPAIREAVRKGGVLLIVATLIFEIGFVAGLLHPWILIGLSLMAFGFHLGVLALSGIHFWKWMVVLIALAIFGPGAIDFGWYAFLQGVILTIGTMLLALLPRVLTWFDSTISHRFEFRVLRSDGSSDRLPPESLEPLGFTFAQGRFACFLDRPILQGCFGAVFGLKHLRAVENSRSLAEYHQACMELGESGRDESYAQRVLDTLEAYVRYRQDGSRSWRRIFMCPPHIVSMVPPVHDFSDVTGIQVVYQERLVINGESEYGEPQVVAQRDLTATA